MISTASRDKSILSKEDIENYIFPASLNFRNFDSLLEILSEYSPNLINFNNGLCIEKIKGVLAYKIYNEFEEITYKKKERKKFLNKNKECLFDVVMYKCYNYKNFYKVIVKINCKTIKDKVIEDYNSNFYQYFWSKEVLNIKAVLIEVMAMFDDIFYEEELFWGDDIILLDDEIERVVEPSTYLKELKK
jgi:hypothetical protein